MSDLVVNEFKKWQCDVRKNVYQFNELCGLIEKGEKGEEGGIVLDPDFQREYKFTVKKESSIIESLLLNIPIPVIYLSQDLNEENVMLNVIDGSHRLRAMYRYATNKFPLTQLTILKNLNGKKFRDLPTTYKNILQRKTQINVECIDITGNHDLEYEVFTRFNQSTNPLTKQELNEVVYRSEFSKWFRKEFIDEMIKKDKFKKIFHYTDKRRKDKTLLYDLYICLGYAYSGLVEGKNDTPYYVTKFMDGMRGVNGEKLEKNKAKVSKYLCGFVDFYDRISNVEDIEHIFSKEFINKTKASRGIHDFLTSFLIILTLTYSYILYKGLNIAVFNEVYYDKIYNAIVKGMNNCNFGDFANESSTSYKVQKRGLESIKKVIDLEFI